MKKLALVSLCLSHLALAASPAARPVAARAKYAPEVAARLDARLLELLKKAQTQQAPVVVTRAP